ncbi:cation diffusion facilitator family transporter [Isosphaeraceae bacterium EP7]
MDGRAEQGIRATQVGLLVNVALVLVKMMAGIIGHSYALVADAVESSMDIFSSLIVWGGLRVASQPADEEHPYGHGKAEPLATAVVALLLLGAAAGITVTAIRGIRAPHQTPAPFTLVVAAAVVVIKEVLYRRVSGVGAETGSHAVKADAWHHRSDAISSLAAFFGIAVALWKGPGWETADQWAALVAAVVIAINGGLLLRPAVHDLMDRRPDARIADEVQALASGVEGVCLIEKLRVRRFASEYFVDMHVQADAAMSLEESHNLSGRVKHTVRSALPLVVEVLIHMEPYEVPVADRVSV